MAKHCEYLNNGITFHHKGITFCNTVWNAENSYIEYKGNVIKNFIEKRNKIISLMDNDGCIPYCTNCLYLKQVENSSIFHNKIKNIEIYHWNECNCACYYCSNRNVTKLKITNKKINGQISILKNLKELKKAGLLDDNLEIHTHGGEPTLLKEFGDIIKFAIKHKYPMTILSNGILYEKNIPKILSRMPESYLTISLDAGTRETYKKIKRVDKFYDVIKNVKRYISEIDDKFSYNLLMKYIILKGVNDNKEEIDKWIDICVSIGVKNFFPSIEFIYEINNHNNSINPNIIELYNYIKTKVKEINPKFRLSKYDFVEEKILKYQSYNIR